MLIFLDEFDREAIEGKKQKPPLLHVRYMYTLDVDNMSFDRQLPPHMLSID